MRIAVIGAGVSGLVAAYKLDRHHHVTVYEANDYPGGHSNTVEVAFRGERHVIDTGFIVFNDTTYPNFIRLLDELAIATQPTQMSFSVRDERTDLEYNGASLGGLFVQRRNLLRPKFHRMLVDILRFQREARRQAVDVGDETTVGDFVRRRRYSRSFVDHYLLPLGAAIWSCPTGVFSQFPIRFIVEFFHNHGLLSLRRRPQWRVIAGGSRQYVQAMTEGFRGRIRLNTPVYRVRRRPSCVEVHARGDRARPYDHVIFACHSDQALRMLGEDATSTERELLGAFPYCQSVAVLHTDTTLLPRRRRAWACWNYRVVPDENAPATITYNMNMLQSIRSRHTFCVTLNDESRIDPRRILRRIEYSHPVFTTRRAAVQARHREVLVANRTSFCGAYWRNGFHEDGVVSALAVADAIARAARPSMHPGSMPASTPIAMPTGAAP